MQKASLGYLVGNLQRKQLNITLNNCLKGTII